MKVFKRAKEWKLKKISFLIRFTVPVPVSSWTRPTSVVLQWKVRSFLLGSRYFTPLHLRPEREHLLVLSVIGWLGLETVCLLQKVQCILKDDYSSFMSFTFSYDQRWAVYLRMGDYMSWWLRVRFLSHVWKTRPPPQRNALCPCSSAQAVKVRSWETYRYHCYYYYLLVELKLLFYGNVNKWNISVACFRGGFAGCRSVSVLLWGGSVPGPLRGRRL